MYYLNIISNNVPITQGVPQESILGHLLFSLYVKKLNAVVQKKKVVQYADDTTVCIKGKTIEELEIVSLIKFNSCILYFSELNKSTNKSK